MFDWFKREEVLLSSYVKGQLLDGDKPLSGITVTRELTYEKEYTDSAITNSNGYFQFSENSNKSSKPKNMFDNNAIRQHLYIKNNDEIKTLWAVRLYITPANDQTLTRNLKNLICKIKTLAQTYDIASKMD